MPDKAERDAVIKKIDYKKIELLPNCQVQIPSGMAIDLGAAAKGYLSQKIIDLCKEKKVASCILSLGGNVQTIGWIRNSYRVFRVIRFHTDGLHIST